MALGLFMAQAEDCDKNNSIQSPLPQYVSPNEPPVPYFLLVDDAFPLKPSNPRIYPGYLGVTPNKMCVHWGQIVVSWVEGFFDVPGVILKSSFMTGATSTLCFEKILSSLWIGHSYHE